MLLATLLLLVACSGDDDGTSTQATDPEVGTATRPIVDPVDSARDTGTPEDTQEPIDTAPEDTGPLPIDTAVHVLEGRAFQFDPSALSLTAGGVGINLYSPNFLVEVLDVTSAGTATLRVASFDPNTGGQAQCTPTSDVSTDFSGDPELVFGPVDGSTGLFGKFSPVEDASGAVTFGPDYETITDAQMSALWDITAFVSYYYGAGYAPNLCSLLGYYGGGGCTTCPTSGSRNCLRVRASNARARWVPNLSLVERTEATVLADPSCF